MIFNSIPWFLVAGFFMCCGCAVAAIVLDRRYRDDRKKTEQGMTKRLQERLAVYDQLETQVKSVIESFDGHERAFKELFAVQKQHIQQLKAALGAHVGDSTHVEPASDDSALSWMDDADEAPIEVVTEDSGPQSVAELQKKLETGRAEQEVVLENELRSLSETQMRIATLQPLQASLRTAEAELTSARSELESWKQKCAELEQRAPASLARSAERNDSVEPLVEELAKVKDVVTEWQTKARELATSKTAEIATLSERLSSLEPVLQQASDSRREAEKWRGEYAGLEQRAAEAAAAHFEEVQHLRGEIADFEGRFAKASSDLESVLGTNHSLKGKVEELGRNLASAQLELDKTRSAHQATLERHTALAAELEELGARSEAQTHEIDALRARCRELDGTSNERAHALAALESRAKELDGLLVEKSRMLAESDARATSLEQRTHELENELEALEHEHGDALRTANERATALQAELTSLSGECRTLRASVAQWTERSQGQERTLALKNETLAEREQRLCEVSARVEVLNLEIARAKETVTERERALHESGAKLERTEAEVQKFKSAMSAHAHQFEVAQSLLAELKPVIENLESELTNDKVARG